MRLKNTGMMRTFFGIFIKECCDFGSHDNQAYKTKSKDLYENYKGLV